MEFRDLKTQYRKMQKEMDEAVWGVLAEGNYIMGRQVTELERQLSDYVGVKHCITCANGTDAMQLALMAWGIGAGDAVFIPDFTFFATGEVVSLERATPIFVDVEEKTFNIDPVKLERKIKSVIAKGELKPRVIIAVDLFGCPADYDKLRVIADRYGLLILEDSAQGFGGSINGKKACSFGDVSTTSFFPAKPLGCYGDGGAIFTDDDDMAELIRSYRIHGKGKDKYDNVRIGLNSRLDTIQAAILQVKLKAFVDYELDDVNKVADKYTCLLADVVVTPSIPKGYFSNWAQYTIVLLNKAVRDGLQDFLESEGIPSNVYYVKPMHQQCAYAQMEYKDEEDLEVTKKLCDRVLSLPIHPYLSDEEVSKIANCIKRYLQ
jgi:dTDP-4-amino-4,6-dideoxygalactose transaminase